MKEKLIKVVIGVGFVVTIFSGAGFMLTVVFYGITKMMDTTDFGDLVWLVNHCYWLSVVLGFTALVSFVTMTYVIDIIEKLTKKGATR